MKKYYRLSITAGDKHFVCDNIKGTDVIIAEFNNHDEASNFIDVHYKKIKEGEDYHYYVKL